MELVNRAFATLFTLLLTALLLTSAATALGLRSRTNPVLAAEGAGACEAAPSVAGVSVDAAPRC